MEKQELRNSLAVIEDEARRIRNDRNEDSGVQNLAFIVSRLTQLVREEIVK